ncbi:MAG: M20/M25/M40 family metallo-hydrolase [Thermodesulfobacteriota bacterium]
MSKAVQPIEILRELIRIDTTNPPGGEAACAAYIEGLLSGAGFETALFSKEPGRPNLVARLSGRGQAPPLLFYGHMDVVTAAGQTWTYPPFEAVVKDGFVWGRGALDMKGGLAMMLAALLRAKAEGSVPAGDIIFAALADEEAGGDVGARYLVEHYPGLFQGVRYAIGEFGGFSMRVGPTRFYPIQIAEKQVCTLKTTLRGPAGHGSLPMRHGTMASLGRLLTRLNQTRLPHHVTPVARLMIERLAEELPLFQGLVFKNLLSPVWCGLVLKMLGPKGRTFEPLLHHTVNATIVRGGEKFNVIPAEIELILDGRILPGYGPPDLLAELKAAVGEELEWEVIRHDPGPADPDLGLFDTLAGLMREADPEGVPLPLILSGTSDARWFSRLGIQTYGFLPMRLPDDFDFVKCIHAADERIPAKAVEFGARVIYELLGRYRG